MKRRKKTINTFSGILYSDLQLLCLNYMKKGLIKLFYIKTTVYFGFGPPTPRKSIINVREKNFLTSRQLWKNLIQTTRSHACIVGKISTKENKETSKQMSWQIDFWNNFIELKITINSKFCWLTCTRASQILINKTYIILYEPP